MLNKLQIDSLIIFFLFLQLFGSAHTFPMPDDSQLQLLLNELNDSPLPVLCPMEVSDFFSQIENV